VDLGFHNTGGEIAKLGGSTHSFLESEQHEFVNSAGVGHINHDLTGVPWVLRNVVDCRNPLRLFNPSSLSIP
jgi:hypothetical protein